MTRKLAPALGAIILASACGDDTIVTVAPPPKACAQDSECGAGEKCVEGGCRPLDLFTCDAPGGARQALVEVTPARASFGAVPVHEDRIIPVTVRNVGTCILSLAEVTIDRASSRDFSCEGCGAGGGGYPLVMMPFDERTVLVHYKPLDATLDTGTLNVVSDDRSFPLVQVPLKTAYEGEPKLRVDPPVLSFGYVAPGNRKTLSLRVSNDGTGNAALTLDDLEIKNDSSISFSFTAPARPFYLSPKGSIEVKVTYAPPLMPPDDHTALLRITSTDPASPLDVSLRGSSEHPPSMVLSSEIVDFGNVPVGQQATRIVTVRNQKKDVNDPDPTADLVIAGVMQKFSSTDFSYSPQVFASMIPGGFVEILFRYTPTAVGTAQGVFSIKSNDDTFAEVDIAIRGFGAAASGAKTVKVEMNYENGGDSWADNDLRQAQMTMENPVGDFVNKKRPAPDWGPFGHPTWFAFGQKDEPQRIILTDANRDGEFLVNLQYIEDCASVPSQLVATVLGISLSALISYVSEGVLNVNGQDISQIIQNLCLDHSGSAVAVRVYLDGNLRLEKTVRLGHKGDNIPAVTLERLDGVFTVKP